MREFRPAQIDGSDTSGLDEHRRWSSKAVISFGSALAGASLCRSSDAVDLSALAGERWI